MAKPKTDAAPKTATAKKGIAASDLQRVVQDIIRHKANASENSGLAGAATKNACERYNLDKKALGLVTGLVKAKDQGKATATLRGILEMSLKLGLFDQIDAFDDMRLIVEEIAVKLNGNGPAEAPKAEGGDKPAEPPADGLGAVH